MGCQEGASPSSCNWLFPTYLLGTYCVLGLMQYDFNNSKGIKFISEKQTQDVLEIYPRTSLAVQWLEVHASTAGGTGLIPGWGN